MARTLDYIAKQVKNITDTLSDENLLQSEGFYEVVRYIARNPGFIFGHSTPYYDSKNPYSDATLISGEFGISYQFLKKAKDFANLQQQDPSEKKNVKTEFFINKTLTKLGKSDIDVKKMYQKLFTSNKFDYITKAMCRVINFNVLNNFNSLSSDPLTYSLFNNNIAFSSLPYGKIPAINPPDNPSYIDYPEVLTEQEIVEMFTAFFPFNINFSDIDINTNIRSFRGVLNTDDSSIKMVYPLSKARGYIQNENFNFNTEREFNCTPLSLETKTDLSFLTSSFFTKSKVRNDATNITLKSSKNSPDGCSTEELSKIRDEKIFVEDLGDNTDYKKITGITGKAFLKSIESLSLLSRNFTDSRKGIRAITVKLFFDKKEDIFVSLRSNDLYFAISCATYSDRKDDLVDIYFNPKTEDVYIVNKNNIQFGYCKGILTTLMSNCEYTLYGQLLQPALTNKQRYELFRDQNIMPILLEDGVVNETKGLEDALLRQNYLKSIKDDSLFFDLFIRNIASYVYSYASQIESEEGGKTSLVWETKENPSWFNEGGVPNHYYIYDVRETFWMNNQNMSIKEVLAFFVSKGGSKYDNSIYFRRLSQRILGIDYYVFSSQLIPILLEEGLLCVDELGFEGTTRALTKSSYVYAYEYASGDVYKKMEKLNGELQENIRLLYGDKKGNLIIDNQLTLLENIKPTPLSFGDKNPALNLVINIHNPIFYNSKDGYLGRIGGQTNTLRDGAVYLSTQDNGDRYLPIEVSPIQSKIYQVYQTDRPFNTPPSHLTKFYEWLVYGPGEDEISKPYLKENADYIVDGYIFPKKADLFVAKYLMPTNANRTDTGKIIEAPLEFLWFLPPGKKTFTRSNLFSLKTPFGASNLTEKSRENLIKLGLVEKKKKEKVEMPKSAIPVKPGTTPPENKVLTQLFTPITKEEADRIYDILLAKYNKMESEIKSEGNNLFTIFCKTQLTPDYRIEIEELWNATYNNMGVPREGQPNYRFSKFPLFTETSRWFGNINDPFLFFLRQAQLEGMKFASANQNSGLLAHEVGFGKTTTSIAFLSHQMLTGASPRTIIFTPNTVYEKFADEIIGRLATGVLGLLGNWETQNIPDKKMGVVKFGNGSAAILLGKRNSKGLITERGLKDYNTEELSIISKWGALSEWAKLSLANLDAGQPKFYTDDDGTGRIPNYEIASNAGEWYADFVSEVNIQIPEIEENANIATEIDNLVAIIEKEIDRITEEVDKLLYKFSTQNRYQIQDFADKDKVKEMPVSIQEWWVENNPKSGKNRNNPKVLSFIQAKAYPQKLWIKDADNALKDGIIDTPQHNLIKAQEKNNIEWTGVLTEEGFSRIRKEERKLADAFFNRTKRNGRITVLLKSIQNMLIDVLGKYIPDVKKENRIVLCSHEAIKRFRVSSGARDKAKKFVSNVDDSRWASDVVNNFYDNLSYLPLSLMELNITGMVVDEIHNFNNLVPKARAHIVTNVATGRGKQKDKNLALLPTQNANALLKELPDGTTIFSDSGIKILSETLLNTGIKDIQEKSYKIQYNTAGKSDLKVGPSNLMSLIFQVQHNSYLRTGTKDKNTIMMSATPFTDNIFQMFTVLGMTNAERMKESNIMNVFDFFITFVREEWRFNITHKNTFGLFAEIQGYYNTAAMSNYIKAFANFKVSDKVIEKSRPLKYLIPQDVSSNQQSGANTSSVEYSEQLKDVSSYIELSDVQKQIIKKIGEFVEGKIPTPYALCPNYGEVIKVSEETGEITFTDPDAESDFNEVKRLLKEADKEDDIIVEREHLNEARIIINSLRIEYPKDRRIELQQQKVDRALFEPEQEEGEDKETSSYMIDFEDAGMLALNKEDNFKAKAIVGQGFGQTCVISPYLLPCDKERELENSLLKDFPLDPNDIHKSAKNFINQSPKIKYAVECALNSIKYDSENSKNLHQIGGQIIYLDRGKKFKYAGSYYNAYNLIKQYILDQKVMFYDEKKKKKRYLEDSEVDIITGGMNKKVTVTDPQTGFDIIDYSTNKPQKVTQKEDIRDKFNDGRVKILLGSSAIKEGVDLNKRAHSLYILDSDFSPSNAMQLEGRIWRQGNMWKYVRIVYVLGKDSIDAFVYSKLQTKINEIKKMLEQGVYELNKTQFTINAKERIRRIISDVGQLTDLGWQDQEDNLLLEKAKFADERTKLTILKEMYLPVKQKFNSYVRVMNSLYELVLENEKNIEAEKIKDGLDIQTEHKYRLMSAGKGKEWRKNNPFKATTLSDARVILDKEIKNKEFELSIPNISLSSNSDPVEVNQVIDKIRRLVINRKNEISNLVLLGEAEKRKVLEGIDENTSLATKIVATLSKFKTWSHYDELLKYVNSFVKGSQNETIISNYAYLISNRTKKGKAGDTYNIDDVEILITNAINMVRKINKALGEERKWKGEESKRIVAEQAKTAEQVGETLEELIYNYNKSMSLLELRPKKD
tara:strand:- start:4249 stop:11568 length:7320 start_codon:yes stop_codon:yes gene_type:complete